MNLQDPRELSFFEQLKNFPNCPPHLIASVISGSYLVFVSIYIWLSGKVAAQFANNKQQLQNIELTKGLLFVLITGGFLFLLLYWTLRQLKYVVHPYDLEEPASLSPFLLTTVIAGSYLLSASLYIWLSGAIAERIARNKKTLEQIEWLKGQLFVVTTAVLLFAVLYWCFSKLKQREEVIVSQSKSILASEKLTITGLFSLSICHDINNVLIVIMGNAEMLQESERLGRSEHQMLEEIQNGARDLARLTKRMMKAGQDSIPGETQAVDLVDLIKETVEFAKRHKKLRNCEIEIETPERLLFTANAALFQRALLNLLLNAADATRERGTIQIKLFTSQENLYIEVHDDGPGVPEELRNKILDPFFTTKADGNGLGLLSFKLCAQQHQGNTQIEASPLGGANFSLSLPIPETKDAPPAKPSTST
ncbi:MAG: HAMP domain-containing histidine kinase [Myxococcales bacterium]|nr:HAMP domain-containing histidine kinase [Myxococcales bacterium]